MTKITSKIKIFAQILSKNRFQIIFLRSKFKNFVLGAPADTTDSESENDDDEEEEDLLAVPGFRF